MITVFRGDSPGWYRFVMTRRLTLRKDALAELTPAELDAVAAAVNLGKARNQIWLNHDLNDVAAAHTAQCALGCTCYCG